MIIADRTRPFSAAYGKIPDGVEDNFCLPSKLKVPKIPNGEFTAKYVNVTMNPIGINIASLLTRSIQFEQVNKLLIIDCNKGYDVECDNSIRDVFFDTEDGSNAIIIRCSSKYVS